jgi:hypothetical protein
MEFSRQQEEDKENEPEIMQFQASQKLGNSSNMSQDFNKEMTHQPSPQLSSVRMPFVSGAPVSLHNCKPQQPQPMMNQNLCLLPSTSSTSLSRVLPTPRPQPSTTQPPKQTRKRKEETVTTDIVYGKDFLCYECGDFFTEKAQFDEHKNYHAFTRIALRMHIEQKRNDVESPEFEWPLNPEEEKEYIKLRSEQVGKKRETAAEIHNTALNPGLHQNHNFAINSTILDKRPAVKVFNIKTGTRVNMERTENAETKPKKNCYFTGDLDNPIAYDETMPMKDFMQKRLDEANQKADTFKHGEVAE